MFLATGATGNVGHNVVERLLARGEKVRALVQVAVMWSSSVVLVWPA